jgi:hypothetical protein
MANKPEFVDLISDRTRQNWRRSAAKTAATHPAAADVKEERRLSNWPPARFAQWRLENLTPWKMKLKPWKFTDWGS